MAAGDNLPGDALVIPLGSLTTEMMRTLRTLKNVTVQFGVAPYNQLVVDLRGNRAFLNIGPQGFNPGLASLPSGGADGEVLTKQSATDGDVAWEATQGMPAGGTDGQVLTKQSGTDYDADWETPSAGGVSYRELTHSITVAGSVPTGSEIDTALAAAYTDPAPDLVPADGDFVILTVSSVPKFVARISTHSITESGLFVRDFTVNSITYYATLAQCGLY